MLYLTLFIFGLAIGSFLNVVSLRFQPNQKLFDFRIIGGRSKCPHCQKRLNWYELIPVLSFIAQKGRCRSCHQKISWQYPIVEIISGFIFVLIPWRLKHFQSSIFNFQSVSNFQFFLFIFSWILIFLLFLLLSIIDIRHLIIPDSINLALFILGVGLTSLLTANPSHSYLSYYALVFAQFNSIWLNHLIGLIFSFLFFGLIILLSRGKGMGWGDFKLAGALGLIFGWPDILISVLLSFLLGGLFGIILIIIKKRKLKETIPFGPFLVFGATLLFFFGFEIINWYFQIFDLYTIRI